jgi:hypothetical protein
MESELRADISKMVICKPHPVPGTLSAPSKGLEPDHGIVQLRHCSLAVLKSLSKVWTDGVPEQSKESVVMSGVASTICRDRAIGI